MENETNNKDIIKYITGGISTDKHSDNEMDQMANNILQKAGYNKKRSLFREFFSFRGKSSASILKPVFAIIILLVVSFVVYRYVFDNASGRTEGKETAAQQTDDQMSITERQKLATHPKEEDSSVPEIKAEVKTITVQLNVDSRALSSDTEAPGAEETDVIENAELTLAGIYSNNQLVFTKSGNRIKTKWYENVPGREIEDQIIFVAEFDGENNLVAFIEKRWQASGGRRDPVKRHNFAGTLISNFKDEFFNK